MERHTRTHIHTHTQGREREEGGEPKTCTCPASDEAYPDLSPMAGPGGFPAEEFLARPLPDYPAEWAAITRRISLTVLVFVVGVPVLLSACFSEEVAEGGGGGGGGWDRLPVPVPVPVPVLGGPEEAQEP